MCVQVKLSLCVSPTTLLFIAAVSHSTLSIVSFLANFTPGVAFRQLELEKELLREQNQKLSDQLLV